MISQPMPVDIKGSIGGRFTARLDTTDLGIATVTRLRKHIDGVAEHRTPRLIRQSDPQAYRLVINLRGHNVMLHDDREAVLGPGDLVLFDSSRPFTVLRTSESGPDHEVVMVTAPRGHVPVPHEAMGLLTGVRLSGRTGLAALVSQFLVALARDVHEYDPADAARLATTVVDLMAVVLGAHMDADRKTPVKDRRRALLQRAQFFIQQRLHDPALTPAAVAAAHHVSTRALHAAFQDAQLTIGSWIRARRLERCRRDLSDPGLATRPVHAIGAKWAFPSAAHFCRAFETAYGITPNAYRRSMLELVTQSAPVSAVAVSPSGRRG
jgi:AraC-like DNA-binding protein